MSKLVSIIIPVYNQADKIGGCLMSIKAQTYSNWEIIIVNDGSTDKLESVLADYQSQFKPEQWQVFSKPNEGANPTRNYGRAQAQGQYLLFCDADIVLKPTMLEKMVKTLEQDATISFVYCSFYYGAKLFALFPYDVARLRKMPYIHTTSLIRADHFPGFDPTLRRLQDWDLWLTMLEQNHYGCWLNEPLFSVKTQGHISTWLPKFAYTLLPFLPTVKKYHEAVKIIKAKHHLA